MDGTPLDPRRHVAALSSLFSSGQRVADVLDRLPAAAYTCDPEGLITYFNGHAERIWGRAPSLLDPVDRWCGSFRLYASDGSPVDHAQCWMALALKNGREYSAREIVVEREDGGRSTVLAHANPLRDVEGALVGAINVLVDITRQKQIERTLWEMKRLADEAMQAKEQANDQLQEALHELESKQRQLIELNELLERQATTDDLTGLKNRRVFQNSLGEMIAVAERSRASLAVLMIDIDRFKRLNDTHGHQAGDRTLREVGRLLCATTREQDVVARYGGEEFAVILPGTDAIGAANLAEAIRRAFEDGTLEFAITVSVGLAMLEPGDDQDRLLGRADAALYAAKIAGRNRVRMADASLSAVGRRSAPRPDAASMTDAPDLNTIHE